MAMLIDTGRLSPDHLLRCGTPVGEGSGSAFAEEALLAPLAAALPSFEVRPHLHLQGVFNGEQWRATSGNLLGRFVEPLFGIPPHHRLAFIRFGRFDRLCGKNVAETLLLLDWCSLMRQAGVWPLAQPRGPDLLAPPPAQPDGTADESLALVEAMIAGLMRFDGDSLASMGMKSFWIDRFHWYGPAAIGSFRGHHDYERGHQRPFLTAFPDRRGGNHRARIAEGGLVASTGWPSIRATHTGGGWLGLAPTGRAVTMRVMDFWACRSGRLTENWVMIDIVDLMQQLGVDLFALMATFTDRS